MVEKTENPSVTFRDKAEYVSEEANLSLRQRMESVKLREKYKLYIALAKNKNYILRLVHCCQVTCT